MTVETGRAAPTEAAERIEVLDLLRGIAIFGMILVHFFDRAWETSRFDAALRTAVAMFLEDKAATTFAILFGVGCAIQLASAERRHDTGYVWPYARRMLLIAVFGYLAMLGVGYNVLFGYAEWGLLLWVVRRWSARALAALVVAWSYLAVVGQHLWHTTWLSSLPEMLVPSRTFTMLVIGVLAYRVGVFDRPREHTRFLAGAMVFGVFSWWLRWFVLPFPGGPQATTPGSASDVLAFLRGEWIALAYVGAVVVATAYAPRLLAGLRPIGLVGRMALTNYLLQIAFFDALFSGHGFGLATRPAYALPGAIAVFACMAVLSGRWLARYRWGPLEWLLRTWMYGKLQPIRLTPAKGDIQGLVGDPVGNR